MFRSQRRLLLLILTAAFAFRAAAVLTIGAREPGPDALNDYLPMAANVLSGEGFLNAAGELDYVRGPGYPLMMAAAQSLLPLGEVASVLWVQALLDTATVWLAFWLATRIFGASAGLWSAALYSVNPLSIYACALVGPETLFAFLLTAALAALQLGIESRHGVWMAVSGVAIGAAVLARATPVLLVPVWGVWQVVSHWLDRRSEASGEDAGCPAGSSLLTRLRRGILHAVILGATSAAVVLPWTYRNWRVFGEFIPVAANGGVNYYAGSLERFWPAPPEHHRQKELRLQELIEAGVVPPQPERFSGPAAGDKYFFALGQANYRLAWEESPAALTGYLFRKSLRLWYATQSGRRQWFVGAVNAAWLLLAVCGVIAAARVSRLRQLVPCLLTIAYFPVVLLAMFPLARYVVGFAPCLCVVGSIACLLIQERVMRNVRDWKPAVGGVPGSPTPVS